MAETCEAAYDNCQLTAEDKVKAYFNGGPDLVTVSVNYAGSAFRLIRER